jgi:hypothetical protein
LPRETGGRTSLECYTPSTTPQSRSFHSEIGSKRGASRARAHCRQVAVRYETHSVVGRATPRPGQCHPSGGTKAIETRRAKSNFCLLGSEGPD